MASPIPLRPLGSGCPVVSPMRDPETAIAHAKNIADATAIDLHTYDDISFVLRSQAFAPIQPDSGHGAQWHTLLVGDSVVDLHGSDHFDRRRVLSGLFKKATLLQEYEHEYLMPVLHRTLSDLRDRAETADLVQVVRRMMTLVMARLAGLDGIGDDASIQRLQEVLWAVELGARSKFVDGQERITREALTAQARLADEYFAPAWERRQAILRDVEDGSLPASAAPTDLITLMVRHADHYGEFGPDAAYREASLLLLASIGSTTNAICFAIWDLQRWLENHPEDLGRRLDPDFLRDCFAESQRLGQTNTMLRTAVKHVVLPSGTEFQRGDVARAIRPDGNADLARGGASTEPPLEFDPHRTLRDPVPLYGLAFGGGAHTCIGKRFVMNEGADIGAGRHGELGVVLRIFLALQEAGVAVAPGYQPSFNPSLSGRPTWAELPIVFVATERTTVAPADEEIHDRDRPVN